MADRTGLMIGSLELGTITDVIDYSLLDLFRPPDKVVTTITRTAFDSLDDTIQRWFCPDFEEESFARVALQCPAYVALDRLDLLGVTLEVAKAGFQEALDSEVAWYKEHGSQGPGSVGEYRYLDYLDVELWVRHLRHLWDISSSEANADRGIDECPLPHQGYRVGEYFGYPGLSSLPSDDDYRLHFLRLILEEVPCDVQLSYELGDWIGYNSDVERFDDDIAAVVDHIDEWLEHGLNKTIVLTEGGSDKRFLERSLGLLYPHLVDYFHFFEFDMGRIEGGVGQLVRLVKAFAAAGVKRRIVALFDNDTAARDALRSLENFALPDTIVVCRYPNLSLGCKYPTLGPSGVVEMDVNGLAGSLELYFGEDVLGHRGRLEPVRWTAYKDKMKAYHGVMSRKGELQKVFEKKLTACERNRAAIETQNWDGMKLVLDTLRTAFHKGVVS